MTTTRTRTPQDLDRNLALDLVRVTEAAAMAAGRWVGRGDKEGGDGAAVDAMRKLINSIPMRGVVVIGEPHPPSLMAARIAERYLATAGQASPGADPTVRRPDDITILSGPQAPTTPSHQPPSRRHVEVTTPSGAAVGTARGQGKHGPGRSPLTSPPAGALTRRHGNLNMSSPPRAPTSPTAKAPKPVPTAPTPAYRPPWARSPGRPG